MPAVAVRPLAALRKWVGRWGLIIALATNSSVNNNNDALFSTAVSVYQTLD